MFDASEPDVGSLRQYAPTYFPCASAGKNRCFCSSLPKRTIGSQTSELLTEITTECDASAQETSSIARTYSRVVTPAPPYSSGTSSPRRPRSAIFGRLTRGYSSFSSSSAAIGTISRSANSWTVRLNSSWSSVRPYGPPNSVRGARVVVVIRARTPLLPRLLHRGTALRYLATCRAAAARKAVLRQGARPWRPMGC